MIQISSKKYGRGPYTEKIKNINDETKDLTKEVNKLCRLRESETGLSLPSNWVKIEGYLYTKKDVHKKGLCYRCTNKSICQLSITIEFEELKI